jgi:hypothetical protein
MLMKRHAILGYKQNAKIKRKKFGRRIVRRLEPFQGFLKKDVNFP